MIRFDSDYTEGCHPSILEALAASNDERTAGYGEDPHSERARELIRAACQTPEADVHFLVGGTQANLTIIAASLKPYQGALCASPGHINCHESGAVEAGGHKVLSLPSDDGKLTAVQIEGACQRHWNDPNRVHTVQPGLVYLSHPTENGAVYTKEELTAISNVCRDRDLTLFVDGARLAYGLAAEPDLSLPELARLCDVFYLGGTKAGALFGEAVVITAPALKPGFRYLIKQRGAMLAKGRVLGIQFECLMKDDLYGRLGRRAVALALDLRETMEDMGIPLRYNSRTNQQFPILPYDVIEALSQKYVLCPWEQIDQQHGVVRICTSWNTRREDMEALLADLKDAMG